MQRYYYDCTEHVLSFCVCYFMLVLNITTHEAFMYSIYKPGSDLLLSRAFSSDHLDLNSSSWRSRNGASHLPLKNVAIKVTSFIN